MEGSKIPQPSKSCFWGLSGQIVNAIAPHTEAHPMALLSQLLAGFGNMVGRQSFFATEADKQRCNLFVLNVGDSSKGRKGTSWGQVRNILVRVDPGWVERNIYNGFGSGEALIWKLRDDQTPEDPSAIPDKKILIMESEFGSLLRVVNKEGNTTSPNLRNAWDGSILRNITKGTSLQASDHHISAIGHITKTELLQLLKQTEVMNGLANRFLFFFVNRSQIRPFGGSPPSEDADLMAQEIKAALGYSSKIREMKRSSQADELWIEEYPALSEGLPGIVGSLSSRSEAQVMRLAMVLSLFNKQSEITLPCLETALAIHEYCIESLRFVFGKKVGVPLADRLFDYICSFEGGVTRTQIRDFLNKSYPRDSVDDALRILQDAKLAESFQVSTGGRPTEFWRQVKIDIVCPTIPTPDKTDIRGLRSNMSDVEVPQ